MLLCLGSYFNTCKSEIFKTLKGAEKYIMKHADGFVWCDEFETAEWYGNDLDNKKIHIRKKIVTSSEGHGEKMMIDRAEFEKWAKENGKIIIDPMDKYMNTMKIIKLMKKKIKKVGMKVSWILKVNSFRELLNVTIFLMSVWNIISIFIDIPKVYYLFISSIILLTVTLTEARLLCQNVEK